MGQPLGSQYILHDLLGRGAMGQVFRGSVREAGLPVAVKILKPEVVPDTEVVTPEYMAPELADHDRATPAADLYSAGTVLHEMLAGRTPFAGGHPIAVLRR